MTETGWGWETLSGSASDLHARPISQERMVTELLVERDAVVLGSSQRDVLDRRLADSRNVEVARRKGGGGAVWLSPGSQLWLEFTIGPHDPLWESDVGLAFGWVGELFEAALGDIGVKVDRHSGAMLSDSAAKLVCFAGLGPGEISVANRKIVGISQRRTKMGSRFQCVVYQDLDHRSLVSLLGLGEQDSESLLARLAASTSDCTALGVSLSALCEAIRRRLPL